jgi:hypothetical protein
MFCFSLYILCVPPKQRFSPQYCVNCARAGWHVAVEWVPISVSVLALCLATCLRVATMCLHKLACSVYLWQAACWCARAGSRACKAQDVCVQDCLTWAHAPVFFLFAFAFALTCLKRSSEAPGFAPRVRVWCSCRDSFAGGCVPIDGSDRAYCMRV